MIRYAFALAGVALLAAAGCQTVAMDNERALAAAGFQMKMADTPDKLARLERLPQRKLTPVPHNEETRFVYADAKYCKCLYVGSQKAYGRYQRLEIHERIAEEQEAAALDWDAWGAWGPWW